MYLDDPNQVITQLRNLKSNLATDNPWQPLISDLITECLLLTGGALSHFWETHNPSDPEDWRRYGEMLATQSDPAPFYEMLRTELIPRLRQNTVPLSTEMKVFLLSVRNKLRNIDTSLLITRCLVEKEPTSLDSNMELAALELRAGNQESCIKIILSAMSSYQYLKQKHLDFGFSELFPNRSTDASLPKTLHEAVARYFIEHNLGDNLKQAINIYIQTAPEFRDMEINLAFLAPFKRTNNWHTDFLDQVLTAIKE